ncbi:MAG TPA: HepT-like ribonuclease domain-containing protein [Phycisphaerae bacterium]|nr:HepT-like ribonuclease domain-containing protein [Phycisphaerae bacterium]
MRLEEKKLLQDMMDSAEAIATFIKGKTFEDMQQDQLLRSAIYYQFVIVGEALCQLRVYDNDLVERISESPRIIGFRNQVVHGYSRMDDEITWRIIQTKLPVLREELTRLLSQ